MLWAWTEVLSFELRRRLSELVPFIHTDSYNTWVSPVSVRYAGF